MSIIIQGNFILYKTSHSCNVKLTTETLSYEYQRSKNANKKILTEIKLCDIYGCKKLRDEDNICHYLKVYFCPLRGKKDKIRRLRKTVLFMTPLELSNEESFSIVSQWYIKLKCSINCSANELEINESIQIPHEENSLESFKKGKRLLILLNPHSGSGQSEKFYMKIVKPLFMEAEIPFKFIKTEYAQHACEIAKGLNLTIYSGLVIIGGDGVLFEVYNGLLQHQNHQRALSTPIGIIPGGSGNGLARSIGHLLSEPYIADPILVSALNTIHCHPSKIDLMIVQQPNRKRIVSFSFISFGIVSDIDFESERLRSIGELRFTLWGVARVAFLKRYRARVSFKRRDDSSLKSNLLYNNVIDDNIFEKPMPPDWETIEGDFVNILVTTLPFISSKAMLAPKATFNDGAMWLTLVDGNISRSNVAKFLLAIDTGTHASVSGVEFFPVTGLRIVPLCSNCKIDIDGERVENGPIHVTVSQECGTIMTRKPN